MGKSAKQQRREAEKERKRAEAAAAMRNQRRRRVILVAVPVIVGLAAGYSWFSVESKALTGTIILGGAMLWLFAGLGFVGSAVPPKDRMRAGSIDFGNKRR